MKEWLIEEILEAKSGIEHELSCRSECEFRKLSSYANIYIIMIKTLKEYIKFDEGEKIEFDDSEFEEVLMDEAKEILITDNNCGRVNDLIEVLEALFEIHDEFIDEFIESEESKSNIKNDKLKYQTHNLFITIVNNFNTITNSDSYNDEYKEIYDQLYYVYMNERNKLERISVVDYIFKYGCDEDLEKIIPILKFIHKKFAEIVYELQYGWIDKFENMKNDFMNGGSINDLTNDLASIEEEVTGNFEERYNEFNYEKMITDIIERINNSNSDSTEIV